MTYNNDKFDELMLDEDVDIIVWGARGYPGAIRDPKMYGWIDTNNSTNIINKVSVKVPLLNPTNDNIVVGAFTFKKLRHFFEAVERMKARKALVNNEYYVDMAINDAITLGYKCKVFEIDSYICWGTPNDLKTFEYWQSCFHKWKSHPYNLDDDDNIPKNKIKELEGKYAHITPKKHQIAS
jgi:hypothetical protein